MGWLILGVADPKLGCFVWAMALTLGTCGIGFYWISISSKALFRALNTTITQQSASLEALGLQLECLLF